MTKINQNNTKSEIWGELKKVRKDYDALNLKFSTFPKPDMDGLLERYDEIDSPIVEEVYKKMLPEFYNMVAKESHHLVRGNRKKVIERKMKYLRSHGFSSQECKIYFVGELVNYQFSGSVHPADALPNERREKMTEVLKGFDNQFYIDRERELEIKASEEQIARNKARKKMLIDRWGEVDWKKHW